MITRDKFGHIVCLQQRDRTWKRYRISNLSQEETMNDDGTVGHYITCVDINNHKVIVNLHPDYINKLFTKREDTAYIEDMSVIEGTVIVEAIPPVPSPKNGKLKGPGIKAIKDSKKDRAYALFGRMYVNAGSKRAIVEAFQRELSMTKAGAQTYYYNCAKDRI